MSIDYKIKNIQQIKSHSEKYMFVNEDLNNIISNEIENMILFMNTKEIKQHIDITYKEGRSFEFCCLNKKQNYMDYIYSFVTWTKENNQIIPQKSINNALISAVTYNKIKLVKYLLTSKELPFNSDMAYCNYACINNALTIKKSPTKEEILKFFIFDMNLEENKEILKIIKQKNREDIINLFKIKDIKNNLNKTLTNNSATTKTKLKI